MGARRSSRMSGDSRKQMPSAPGGNADEMIHVPALQVWMLAATRLHGCPLLDSRICRKGMPTPACASLQKRMQISPVSERATRLASSKLSSPRTSFARHGKQPRASL
eukprot:5998781-Amphidinium_carterae.2